MDMNGLGPDFLENTPDHPVGPQPKDYVVLLLRAAWRRKIVLFSVFVIGCATVFGYYRIKKPVYRVEAKIMAQRQQVLPSALRSGSEDLPTKTAWELIHRRENLLAIAKSAELIKKGAVVEKSLRELAGLTQPTPAFDPFDVVVKVLDRRLFVETDEGTVGISFDWHDPTQAYRVVDAAVQNFIEARHVQEVTAIDEVMSVLRVKAAKAKENLERVTDEVKREGVEGPREPVAVAGAGGPLRPKGPPEDMVRLKTLLDGKTRAIEDVEEFRRRRLADLHAQLDERRATYSDAHPVVVQLRQDIEALSQDSAQLTQLRADEAKLRQEYQARLAQENAVDSAAGARAAAASAGLRRPAAVRPIGPVEEDDRVRDARFQYQQIAERVSVAELELDAVRAAFKYRYTVIWPPEVPRDPISPNPQKIFGAGLLVSLLLALLIAAAPDLRSGRIVERWQLERGLGLPILAEFNRR